VPDNYNVCWLGGLRNSLFNRADDARLRIRRGLPALYPLLGMREECINGRVKLLFGEETRRRAIILAEVRYDAVTVVTKSLSEDLSASRVLRSPLAKMHRSSLAQGGALIERIRSLPRSLSGQSGTETLGSITTSGCVMKKTVGTEFPSHTVRQRIYHIQGRT
jgi:hypothetical protein